MVSAWKVVNPRRKALASTPFRKRASTPESGDSEVVSQDKIDFERTYDTKKSEALLGMRWRGKEEAAAFMIEDYKNKGWI